MKVTLRQFTLHDPISMTVYIVMIVSWLIFFFGFRWFQFRRPKTREKRRDRVSIIGIILQGAGFATVWIIQRPLFAPILPMPTWAEVVLAIVTMLIAAGSIWLVFSAVRTLGVQWAYVARITEGHRLITGGPYRWVRNPIYTGMLGMMLATGLAVSNWIAFPIAIVAFGAGTYIRVSREEKILHGEFGEQWDEYKRRVHAVLPGLL
jgi:protein-S-isoprenylcysteine O-methyltransferase Ste14